MWVGADIFTEAEVGPGQGEEGTFAGKALTLWAVCSGRFHVLGIMGIEQHLLPLPTGCHPGTNAPAYLLPWKPGSRQGGVALARPSQLSLSSGAHGI